MSFIFMMHFVIYILNTYNEANLIQIQSANNCQESLTSQINTPSQNDRELSLRLKYSVAYVTRPSYLREQLIISQKEC